MLYSLEKLWAHLTTKANKVDSARQVIRPSQRDNRLTKVQLAMRIKRACSQVIL